jgi:hypothetical protein
VLICHFENGTDIKLFQYVLEIGFTFVKRDFFVFGKRILRQLTDFLLEVVTESCLALCLLAFHLIREIPDRL